MDLKLLRAKNGYLKQVDFAAAAGFTITTVAKWETGKAMPDIRSVKRIATVLNVSTDEVISCFLNDNEAQEGKR